MHRHNGCQYLNLEKNFTVTDLAAFHGHLGPYIVIGYRIGKYARENVCNNPFELQARVYCAGTPPESCLADGVQLGSGCTLGKRNIKIIESDQVAVEFETDGRTVRIVPRPFDLPKADGDDYEALIEAFAEEMYYLDDAELFTAGEH
ncbi:formylmethanofuran dehydrogenase subunit E family protein [Methanofollis sp. UBA420]|jgi:formylmethanofuran dehydrogenase subunit E|uniref:formylmethanofuran dehydrogenase subunit E family protein n=1 Tax=Methanofollis sp. UBA420 TaxID=1915514 RepID=UPI00316AD54A